MKKKIHPRYKLGTVSCACGNSFQVRSVVGDMNLEICSACHPFFTGKQKLLDTTGRVEKFLRKYKLNLNDSEAGDQAEATDSDIEA